MTTISLLLFPLNKKETQNLNEVLNVIQILKIKMREKYLLNFNDIKRCNYFIWKYIKNFIDKFFKIKM